MVSYQCLECTDMSVAWQNALVIYLQSVKYREHGRTYKADTHFVMYTTGRHFHPFRDKSGAYTFIPDGAAKVSTLLIC